MRIAVAIKQVPARDSLLRIDSSGRHLDESNLAFEINEADAYALEEGLHLAAEHGGEVVALCAGPPRAAQALREALAKGADRALHIEQDLTDCDALACARLLAAAARTENPDLILTGLQSDDLGYGQTGVILAELLDLPHASIVVEVELRNGTLRAKRELEAGWRQWVEMPLPAVLTIQSGIRKLRYATLMGIRKARSKELRVLRADDLGGLPEARVVTERLFLSERSGACQMLGGTPREAAASLLEKLRFEAGVL